MPNYTYRPIIRWKRGERGAIKPLSPLGKTNVFPVFCIGQDQFKDTKTTKARPSIAAAAAFVSDVASDWGYFPCYVDASGLAGAAFAPHPIVDIATHSVAINLPLIPATRLDAPIPYTNAAIHAASLLGTGIGLRVDLGGMTSAASWVASWPISPSLTDLIVDVTGNVGYVATLGPILNTAFSSLYVGANWRSVTFVGTSMPDDFSGYKAGLYTVHRMEIDIWQNLISGGLPYRLDFGDYATVPNKVAPANIRWGFPITVRYSLPNDFLICRGVPTTGISAVDMDVQLKGHATSIVGYHARSALSQCTADHHIDQIAIGAIPPGNLETWVGLGVNRHIEITRSYLP